MTWRTRLSVAEQIERGKAKLKAGKVTVGFDGFVDVLVRPVAKTASVEKDLKYFQTIEEFGGYLSAHKGISCSVETEVFVKKFGGNGPHVSNALSCLGADVDCIGTFGKDKIEPVFSNLPCRLYSFDEPGISTALEFSDGKVMLGERICKKPDWSRILACTAKAGTSRLLGEPDILALVNWSEISYSYELWQKVLEEYLKKEGRQKERVVFFDLCDISRKSSEEVLGVLNLIREFSAYRQTILSMNRKEATLVSYIIGTNSCQDAGEKLLREWEIDQVIVHGCEKSILVTRDGTCVHRNNQVKNPILLTGAGDTFNGAFCAAMLLGLEDEERLWFAARFAEDFVRRGKPGTLEEMEEYALEMQIKPSKTKVQNQVDFV